MTTDEGRVLAFISMLHVAREDKKAAELAEGIAKEALTPVLKEMPEGERELWDRERDPPIGVALRGKGSGRWLEVTALDDETIVWAARHGLLGFGNGGVKLYDAMKKVPDRETQHFLAKIAPHVHDGGENDNLVLLPERRTR